MKNVIYLLALLCVLFSSCEKLEIPQETSNETTTEVVNKNVRDIQFVLKGLDVEYATRATLASESITDLYVFEGDSLLCHQLSTDSDFGVPTIALVIGTHDLTFIASKAEGQSWSKGIWTCTKVKDTYGTVLTYTVSKSSSTKQVELTRVNAKIKWTIEDAIPTGAKTLSAGIVQHYLGLDANLNGVNPVEYNVDFDISSNVGVYGMTLSINSFAGDYSEGSQETASIKVTNSSGSILCNYSNEVTIMPNKVINIHGDFFSATGTQTVSIDTSWGETEDISI